MAASKPNRLAPNNNHQGTKRLQEKSNIIALDPLASEIVDCAFKVHQALGPGLLESIYEEAFSIELTLRNIAFIKQMPIPVYYRNKLMQTSFRLDILVNDQIIVELKSVENLNKLHDAQVLNYMRLAKKSLGFLINFNVPLVKQGIRRFAL